MIDDAQRAQLFRAEERVWSSDHALSEVAARELVAEFSSALRHPVRLELVGGTGHVKLFRGAVWAPQWALRPLVLAHELTHALISPLYPAHGAEFAARELEVVRGLVSVPLAEQLEAEFDHEHVHHDVEVRRKRARRVLVNYANQHPGKLLQVVLGDPPELLVGAVGERVDDAVLVGDELASFDRLRYVTALP